MIRKSLRWTAVALGGAVACWLLLMLFSPYLRRWTLLMYADVYDYDKLPSRAVARNSDPFRFPQATGGDWIAPLQFKYGGQAIADEAALGRFLESHGTTAFIVVHKGLLLDERYFNGFRRDSMFKSFSVTKSVVSALLGAAIDDGLVGGIDDPVTKYLPEMRDPRFARVTLRNCLDSTAGVHYEHGVMPWTDQPRMYYTTDVRAYVRRISLDVPPDTRFSTEDLSSLVLGAVLERALERRGSQQTLSAYLSERIWRPVGAEYDAVWNLDRQDGGLEKAESGLTARAIDLAKFAVLYLNDGRWGSRQIIPAGWVRQSTTLDAGEHGPNIWRDGFFKHQWWGRKPIASARSDYYANGHFGQRLYISPRSDLVLVRMGDSNQGVDWADFLGAVADAFGAAGANSGKMPSRSES